MSVPGWLRDSLLIMEHRNKVYDVYDKLYTGDLEEHFTNTKVKADLSSTDYYRLNLCRTVVDAPLERTEISGIVASDDKARNVLEDFWTENQFDFESKSAHELSYIYGNSAVICLPDENGVITAYVHNPKDVAVFYNPAKPREKSHAVHTYVQFGDGEEGTPNSDQTYLVVVVYGNESIQRWVSTSPLVNQGRVDYNTIDLRMAEELDNPVNGVIPVFHFRTSRTPTGRSRLTDALGPQLMINDTITALMASIKAAGFKQRYLLTSFGNTQGDNFSEVNPDEGVETNTYQAGPSEIFHFAGNDVRVGTFDVSESSNFTEPIEKTISWMSMVTDIPAYTFGLGATPPSGEALRRSEQPLNSVVDSCQALFGATWAEMFDYILALAGVAGEAEVSWDQQVATDQDYWDVQTTKTDLGFPNALAFIEAGYSPETVAKFALSQALEVGQDAATPEALEGDEDLIPPTAEGEEI